MNSSIKGGGASTPLNDLPKESKVGRMRTGKRDGFKKRGTSIVSR